MFSRIRVAYLERKGFNGLAAGDFQTALTAFQALMEQEPSRPGVRHNLGLAYLGAEDFAKAQECFLRDLETLGDHFPRLKVLGDLCYIWGKREDAHHWYKRAILDEDAEPSRVLLEERIRQTASDDQFSQVQEADAAYRAGLTALQDEQYQEALDQFQKAATLNPTHVLALNNAGTVLMNNFSRYDEARKAFRAGLEMEPLPILQMNLEKVAEAEARTR